MSAAAAVVAVLVLSASAVAAPHPRLSPIASEIARQPVRVECKPQTAFPGRAAGTAFHGRGLIWLLGDYCAQLTAFARSPASPLWYPFRPGEASRAYVTLTNAATALAHEAWHLRGVRDEATTDCYAVQTTWLVLHRLGASKTWAKHFANAYVPTVHGLPAISGCRDGGPLDLAPERRGWPTP